jgi:hypothetical protein
MGIDQKVLSVCHTYIYPDAKFHDGYLSDKGVAAIARGCSGLVKLDVSYCEHVTKIPMSELPAQRTWREWNRGGL